MSGRRWAGLGLWAVAVLAGDQLAKAWVVGNLGPGKSVPLIGSVLRLTYVTNTGGAFGLLRERGGLMVLVSLVVLGVLIFLAWRLPLGQSALLRASYGMVLGGALSNVADRLARGHVVDYLCLRYGGRELWPDFNIGDAGITIGLIAIVLLQMARPRERG